tara:strand:- start:690 stop:935 length:246 start_codon:yes stop_codon:yes gene_type:complete
MKKSTKEKTNRELMGEFSAQDNKRSSYIYKKDNKYEVDLFEDDKLIKKVDMRNYPIAHARFVAEMWYIGLSNYITKRSKKQ